MKKKTLQTNIGVNDPFHTRPTLFSVIQIIHCSVGLKCFFSFTKMFFVIIVIYLYFAK